MWALRPGRPGQALDVTLGATLSYWTDHMHLLICKVGDVILDSREYCVRIHVKVLCRYLGPYMLTISSPLSVT